MRGLQETAQAGIITGYATCAFPRTVRGRVAAGTGMAAVGGYGVQVGRAGRAEYAQRNFTNEDSREYNRAADQWVAAGKGKGKRFKAKYYNQSRRQFVRTTRGRN